MTDQVPYGERPEKSQGLTTEFICDEIEKALQAIIDELDLDGASCSNTQVNMIAIHVSHVRGYMTNYLRPSTSYSWLRRASAQ